MTQALRDGGFTDIHCHGGGGFYFSDPSTENIQKAIDIHRASGTANIVASLVTADLVQVKEQIERLIPFFQSGEIAGIHLEGPYLSHRRCGAHKPSLLREPKLDEIKELIEIGNGAVVMFTIAPELPGALQAISYMADNHVIAAIGHSDGTFEDAKAGIDAGAKVVTHFTNAMSKLHEGAHTFATAVLEDSRVHLELIVDGHHVPLDEVKKFFDLAGNRLVLITDAMSAAGSQDGDYFIGDLEVEVKNSVARLKGNGSLAGSTLTMKRATEVAQSAGISEADILHSSSVAPLNLLKSR